MSTKVYKKKEIAPSHAGSILKSGFIEQHNLNIEMVADLLGLTRGHLSRIINGHSPVTPDIAIRLDILTQVPASQWLAMQAKYDSWVLEHKKEFVSYKQTLNNWLSNSLPMLPNIRRSDKKSKELVSKAALLAREIGRTSKSITAFA